MKTAAVLLATGALLAAALMLAACGDDGGWLATTSPTATTEPATGTSETTSTTEATTIAEPAFCDYYDVEGCALYGLVLAEALPTADALAAVESLPGVAIAVWRADDTCVLQASMAPPGTPVATEPSRFAYVDAEGIRQRRLQASGTVAPPITGMFISESYWNHWEDQWSQAQQGGVLIEAVAVYLPERVAGAAGTGPLASFAAIVPLEWRRTDTLDPNVYVGELLLVSEGFPEGYLSEPPPIACG